MLWFAAGVWLLLAVILSMRLAYQRDRFGREARSPAAFTGAYLENLRRMEAICRAGTLRSAV